MSKKYNLVKILIEKNILSKVMKLIWATVFIYLLTKTNEYVGKLGIGKWCSFNIAKIYESADA